MTAVAALSDRPGRPPVVLAARGIRKSFGGVEVLHGVDFTLRRGEVHGLVGPERRGQVDARQDHRRRLLARRRRHRARRRRARGSGEPGESRTARHRDGVPGVQPHPGQMPVGQNILLTREPKGRLRAHRRSTSSTAGRRPRSRASGADIDPGRLVEQLPVGAPPAGRDRQGHLAGREHPHPRRADRVARRRPRSRCSWRAVRKLTAEGIAVDLHLPPPRRGHGHLRPGDGAAGRRRDALGADLRGDASPRSSRACSAARSRAPSPTSRGRRPQRRAAAAGHGPARNGRLRDVSFELHRGEIVGVAGLLGSGRSELMRAIFGIDRLDAGTIEVDGHAVPHPGPRDALRRGHRAGAGGPRPGGAGARALGGPEHADGRVAQFARRGFVDDDGAARRAATGFVERLNIRTTGLDQAVRDLSGGNQQKVVVAKNLSVQPVGAAARRPDRRRRRRLQARDPDAGPRRSPRRATASCWSPRSSRSSAAWPTGCWSSRDGAVVRVLDRAAGDDLSEEALSRAVQEQDADDGRTRCHHRT